MKTMLGGWEDVPGLLGSENRRSGSAAPSVPASQRHGVALTPRESCSASAARHPSLLETRLGGVSPALPPLPGSEHRPTPRAARQQPLPRPARQRATSGAPGAARLALDRTCEIEEADLVLLVPLAAPSLAAASRRGGTLIDPALCIVPAPRRRRARCLPSLLQALVRWAQALLGRSAGGSKPS